ncbi:MAG: hypothetical protein ACREL7_03085 [Longimicrobiales bacterium]
MQHRNAVAVTPEVERRLRRARYLITSRLALVESARALHRLRQDGVAEAALADAARETDSIWARCTIREVTWAVCELASQVAPGRLQRTLDALHLATFSLARRQLRADVEVLTADRRLEEAMRSV